MKPTSAQSACLDTRITALEITGRSVSDDAAAALQAAVQKDITEIEIIRVSHQASEPFAAALIDPPPANAAMKRVIAHHRRAVERK